jgi:hypothetical protein
MNSSKKHITRVKVRKTNGWQVRLTRNGINHSKFFSVKRFGGVKKALHAAIKYRDSLISMAPPVSSRIRTGLNDGIHIDARGSYRAWVAQWIDGDGNRKKKSFNIKKHGNLKAKTMARKARMLGVARLGK